MEGLDAVVAVDIDGGHVDGIVETALPVACGIEFASLNIVDTGFVKWLKVLVVSD